jgi:uncharacterized protein involved in exopolysaccharide biosynthesis/Mrp family chromosome partitioning ATPase
MVATSHRLVTPRDIARILFRHWQKMAAFFCGVIVLTLIVIAVYPRSYSSEAKLLLRVGRESVALDPTATTGETIMLQKSQADEIASAINILKNRNVLERVAERVGAQRINDDLPTGGTEEDGGKPSMGVVRQVSDFANSCVFGVLRALRLSDPTTEVESAVRRLQSRVSLWTPKESTVITISYSAASPELAHDVVDALTDVFLEEHVRLGQSEGSLAFFSEQVDKLHGELTKAQAELRDRKNAFRLTASNADRSSISEKTGEALRQKLYDLELQESELKSRYTDEYPPLKDIRRQRGEVAQALMRVTGMGLIAKSSAPATGQADDDQENPGVDVIALNNQAFELSQLERTVQLLEGKYKMHVEKLEQARVNEALGREQISNVKVAQEATLVRKADSPNKALLLALGVILATIGSVALAYLAEWFDQTLRTTDQVESELGLPVLLSLPQRKRRRKSGAEPAVAAANGHAKANGNGHGGQVQIPSHARLSNYGALVREIMANGENGAKNGDRHAKMVGIVGCDTSKVRSRVAAELAMQAASTGTDPVLLIDADARRRRVTKRFHINGSPGWREVLTGQADPENCIHHQEVGNLAVMSPGSPYKNEDEPSVRPTAAGHEQLDGIKSDYGLVVVDMPPERDMEAVPAGAEWLDEMVLVVEAEHTRIQSAQRAKDMLERAGVHVTGVVLANRREHIPRWLYQRL